MKQKVINLSKRVRNISLCCKSTNNQFEASINRCLELLKSKILIKFKIITVRCSVNKIYIMLLMSEKKQDSPKIISVVKTNDPKCVEAGK